jgi:hypothetical protein
MTVLLSAARNIFPHIGACTKNQITSGGRYVHSSGRLVTRLTAFHISRYVASSFKRLTTATTHCDLIKFYQHRRGNPSCLDIAHDPVHYPYSDCRIINIQLLYRTGDRLLGFCRSYITRLLTVLLAEHLFDMDSGSIHRLLGFMHLGFHFNS